MCVCTDTNWSGLLYTISVTSRVLLQLKYEKETDHSQQNSNIKRNKVAGSWKHNVFVFFTSIIQSSNVWKYQMFVETLEKGPSMSHQTLLRLWYKHANINLFEGIISILFIAIQSCTKVHLYTKFSPWPMPCNGCIKTQVGTWVLITCQLYGVISGKKKIVVV